MVVFSCLLSVSYTACQSYNRTGHNGHLELGERTHQWDRGHSPQITYAATGIGDIVLNIRICGVRRDPIYGICGVRRDPIYGICGVRISKSRK